MSIKRSSYEPGNLQTRYQRSRQESRNNKTCQGQKQNQQIQLESLGHHITKKTTSTSQSDSAVKVLICLCYLFTPLHEPLCPLDAGVVILEESLTLRSINLLYVPLIIQMKGKLEPIQSDFRQAITVSNLSPIYVGIANEKNKVCYIVTIKYIFL